MFKTLNNDIIKLFTKDYYETVPYQHCIIENFLNDDYLKKLIQYCENLEISTADWPGGNRTGPGKYAWQNFDKYPIFLKEIINELNSKDFIELLENLTGIKNLIVNNKTLYGAGIHKNTNKARLSNHIDFNIYQDKLYGLCDRRINVLIYLNPNWKLSYKGDLWMCSKDKLYKKISPISNRCVIFSTTSKSIHGHPELIDTKDDSIHRNSLALYYYSKNTKGNIDFENTKYHGTIYYENRGNPVFKKNGEVTEQWKKPPTLWNIDDVQII